MIPQAHVLALPRTSGEGRLRHRVAVSSRQSWAYSTFRPCWLKASVRWVISSKRACSSLGTCCEVLLLVMPASFSSQCERISARCDQWCACLLGNASFDPGGWGRSRDACLWRFGRRRPLGGALPLLFVKCFS